MDLKGRQCISTIKLNFKIKIEVKIRVNIEDDILQVNKSITGCWMDGSIFRVWKIEEVAYSCKISLKEIGVSKLSWRQFDIPHN